MRVEPAVADAVEVSNGEALGLSHPPLYWEGHGAAALFVLVFGLVLFQIVARTPWVGGVVWTEELTRWLWVWMALFGCAATQAHRQHVRMEVFHDRLPKRWLRRSDRLQIALVVAVLLYLAWQGVRGVLRTWHNEAVTLPLTDAALYAALPVAMALWLWRIARMLATGEYRL
jgi:TRAP-type C4-dicarboxylate transport system permease small subunit